MNHETQRLLFAAGRGARVQMQTHYGRDWRNTAVLYCTLPYLHRIHPEDVHLQYGPVSAELRRMADFFAGGSDTASPYWLAAYVAERLHDLGPWQTLGDEELSWLCAFAAELAADEGM